MFALVYALLALIGAARIVKVASDAIGAYLARASKIARERATHDAAWQSWCDRRWQARKVRQ